MRSEDSFDAALERDRVLAAEFDVEFTVIAGSNRRGNKTGRPEQLGAFDDPRDAVEFARSVDRPSVSVMTNGRGGYWISNKPDQIFSIVLDTLCRDLRLGPELAQLAQNLDALRSEQSTLLAESVLFEAAKTVVDCEDEEDAIGRLVSSPLELSRNQAQQLLSNKGLRHLTTAGRCKLADELHTLSTRIESIEATLAGENAS